MTLANIVLLLSLSTANATLDASVPWRGNVVKEDGILKLTHRQTWIFSNDFKQIQLVWDRSGEFTKGRSPCMDTKYRAREVYTFRVVRKGPNFLELSLKDKKVEASSSCEMAPTVGDARITVFRDHAVARVGGMSVAIYPVRVDGVWEWHDVTREGRLVNETTIRMVLRSTGNRVRGWYDLYSVTRFEDNSPLECNGSKSAIRMERYTLEGTVGEGGVLHMAETSRAVLSQTACDSPVSRDLLEYRGILEGDTMVLSSKDQRRKFVLMVGLQGSPKDKENGK